MGIYKDSRRELKKRACSDCKKAIEFGEQYYVFYGDLFCAECAMDYEDDEDDEVFIEPGRYR